MLGDSNNVLGDYLVLDETLYDLRSVVFHTVQSSK